jgi:hypothetical protein
MTAFRRAILAFVLAFGCVAPLANLHAQTPIPAEPDTERRTHYTPSAQTGPFAVGFDLYGDGVDYQNWIKVFVNGIEIPQSGNWTLSLTSGTLSTSARPISNAQITFTGAQTGTLDIVGARRPRRMSQFAENRGVTARDLNQVLTDLWMTERERWDLNTRIITAPAGETLTLLPPAATRASKILCFDATGQLTTCSTQTGGTFAAGTGISMTGSPTTTIALANALANTIKGNPTGSTAAPTDIAVPSCSVGASALKWTANTGIGCNLNNARIASSFAGADWCVKLVAAIADIGAANAGTIIIDSNAVAGACTAGAPINLGANKRIIFNGDEFTLNQQILVGTNNSIQGSGAGAPFVSPFVSGTRLKWTGATSTAMVKFFDASHSILANIGINCNAVTGCIGIWMESDNAPSSTNNTFRNIAIAGFNRGMVIGSLSGSAVSPASCAGTPAQTGCSQNDSFEISNVHLVGNCADTAAVGFHINSQNAGQISNITRASVQCVNIGFNLINMNGVFRLDSIANGSMIGATPTLFNIGAGVQTGPNITNSESESGTNAIVSAVSGGAMVWSANQFNQPVILSGGGASIHSIGNTYASLVNNGYTGLFTSGNDIFGGITYTTTGGQILKIGATNFLTVATLPVCNNPSRGQRYTVTDANAPAYNAVAAGGGAVTISVGCDGTNWRTGN